MQEEGLSISKMLKRVELAHPRRPLAMFKKMIEHIKNHLIILFQTPSTLSNNNPYAKVTEKQNPQ